MGKSLGVVLMSRIAVVPFDLGGNEKPESVEPYPFNFFDDAGSISIRQAPLSRQLYEHPGGSRPLLQSTEEARALRR